MGFLDVANAILGGPVKPPAGPTERGPSSDLKLEDGTYNVIQTNWYMAKPYGFRFTPKSGGPLVFFLPINPSNINIATHFATNIVPTLYGTVEEHSDIRYYDITISGTTGIAPKYMNVIKEGSSAIEASVYSNGRLGRGLMPINAGVGLGGFFSKTIGVINNAIQKATDLLGGEKKNTTGVSIDQTGYLAFHNLYRFLMQYKKDAAGTTDPTQRQTHPLTFFNYKDNNQYDVAIKSFNLTRSADNPMLYNYTIVMRGYNLKTLGTGGSVDDLNDRLTELGLNGINSSSLLGDIKKFSNKAKSVIGSLGGGINILGR